MKHRPIGIYDSGIGGISVLKALQSLMPNENFVYFGDTANLPYGNKTPDQIIGYSNNIISWFQNEIEAKLVITACNTSSALALDLVTRNYKVNIIGTIRPLIEPILSSKLYKKIGIIATEASVKSKMHEKILLGHGFSGEIISIACPYFTPLIESETMDVSALETKAREYLRPFNELKLDTLLYGCTHYPLIKSIIEPILPSSTYYIDPAEYIAREAFNFLESNSLLNDSAPEIKFYCSGDEAEFSSKLARTMDAQPRVHQQETIRLRTCLHSKIF